MQGDNVLHALAFDAFGLPAEQYAVQTGEHPRTSTEANIAIMQRQLRRLGLAHDSRRSFATIDPGYVRWTQWIFLQIFDSWYDETAPRPTAAPAARGRSRSSVAEYDVAACPRRPSGPTLDAVERRRVLDTHRLAYVSETPVNWCPGLGTVLANEEVTSEGRSERGNFPVFQRSLRQWNMRITAYADRLVDDLELIDWPDKVKAMQRNWIGRSSGARVRFAVQGGDAGRGVHHPAGHAVRRDVRRRRPRAPAAGRGARRLARRHQGRLDRRPRAPPADAVAAYRAEAAAKSAIERQADAGKKTGVFTGHLAANPVNGDLLPVFTADYVLMGYGTGAIMAVPGGDERDFAFAEAFDLPVVYTIDAPEGTPSRARAPATAARSTRRTTRSRLDGLAVAEAKAAIIDWLTREASARAPSRTACATGCSAASATGASRSRSSTTSTTCRWPSPSRALPVNLPDVPGLLAAHVRRRRRALHARAAAGPQRGLGERHARPGRRPQAVPPRHQHHAQLGRLVLVLPALPGPDQRRRAGRPRARARTGWARATASRSRGSIGGVDLYVGGVEHAVLHLLYARFWHKVLHDLGHVSSGEPFHKLFNQGYIQAYAYTDARGVLRAGRRGRRGRRRDGYTWNGEAVNREYGKMGKSLKNVVTPDDMYAEYGADTLRVYEMSMGPLDLSRPWETRAVVGVAALPAAAVAQRRRRGAPARRRRRTRRRPTRRCACCTGRSPTSRRTWRPCGSTPRSPSSSC